MLIFAPLVSLIVLQVFLFTWGKARVVDHAREAKGDANLILLSLQEGPEALAALVIERGDPLTADVILLGTQLLPITRKAIRCHIPVLLAYILTSG